MKYLSYLLIVAFSVSLHSQNTNENSIFIDKIYNICNRPIRKVKANNEMKKAVKEVIAI